MAAITIHTGVPTSPKHLPLSDGAFRLWVHALCWSKEHLTDGFIPSKILSKLHSKSSRFVHELLFVHARDKGPLWHQVDGGYQIHDYTEWQETKGKVQERRQQWRDRQERHRQNLTTVTRDTQNDVTRESRVSHAFSPSDGSGSGSGKGKQINALFDRFWQAYPKKRSKGQAEKSFAKLKADAALVERMLSALSWQRQQPSWTKDNGEFIPNPATWLNARGWEDERQVNGSHQPEGPPLPAYRPGVRAFPATEVAR